MCSFSQKAYSATEHYHGGEYCDGFAKASLDALANFNYELAHFYQEQWIREQLKYFQNNGQFWDFCKSVFTSGCDTCVLLPARIDPVIDDWSLETIQKFCDQCQVSEMGYFLGKGLLFYQERPLYEGEEELYRCAFLSFIFIILVDSLTDTEQIKV